MPDTPSPLNDLQVMATALQIANRAAIADIECNAHRVNLNDGQRWYDTRPMLDPNERAPQTIDMARESLDFAVSVGLVIQMSTQPHLVCVLQRVSA